MNLLSWILLGLVAGVLAKWIMPGDDPGGIIVTILIGIAGALIGGLIASLLNIGGIGGFNIGSVAIATGGSILLLMIYRKYKSGKSGTTTKIDDASRDKLDK